MDRAAEDAFAECTPICGYGVSEMIVATYRNSEKGTYTNDTEYKYNVAFSKSEYLR